MKALLLAAGIGRRMGADGMSTPKCLMSINGDTLLGHKARALRELGIGPNDLYIVAGKEGTCWTDSNINLIRQYSHHTLINPKNVSLEQGYSLAIGLERLPHDDTYILDADLLVSANTLRTLATYLPATVLLTQRPHVDNPAGNKVLTDTAGTVQHVSRLDTISPYTIYLGGLLLSKNALPIALQLAREQRFHRSDIGLLLESLAQQTPLVQHIDDGTSHNVNTLADINSLR